MNKEELYAHLVKCSNAYYNSGISLISDEEFDKLVQEYEFRFNTTYSYLGKAINKKIILPIKMPSLNKVKDQHGLDLYHKRIIQTESSSKYNYLITAKVDGVSCLFVKKENKVSLMTRGDGSIGSDISHLLPYLPFNNITKDCIIRGELVLYNSDLISSFGNDEIPRNLVSGIINSKQINIEELKLIHFIGYYVPGMNMKDTITFLNEMNIETPLVSYSSSLLYDSLKDLLLEWKKNINYNIDGLVIYTSHYIEPTTIENPKYSIAFKISSTSISTKVIEVEWNISRYGQLCPRIRFNPIRIDNVIITYATAFNAKYIVENKIGPGAIVSITRSGDVIPYIVSVISQTSPQLPSISYKWINDIHITTIEDTNESILAKLTHFMTTLQVKGIKESIIQKLIDAGYDTEEKILFLTNDDLLSISSLIGTKGNCHKTCDKISQLLMNARSTITIDKLLIGSSLFQSFGEKKMNLILMNLILEIISFLQSKDNYIINHKTYLESLHKIGIKTIAESFISKLELFKNKFKNTKILNLAIKNTNINNYTDISNKEEIKGTIVFSGFRDKVLSQELEMRGYKIVESVTTKTKAVIIFVMESSSKKVEQARKLNITILKKENCLEYLN
jgi:DNA ligase (NAD+)